jgi:hypothetical protein
MAATTIREEVLPSESAGNGVAEQGCSQDQLADLLVCDMNARPWLVREPIKDLLQFLRPGGHVVMTVGCADCLQFALTALGNALVV